MEKKIISSFGTKKKTLSFEKEKKTLAVIAEEIKKIKIFHPDTPKITQLKDEIQLLETKIAKTNQELQKGLADKIKETESLETKLKLLEEDKSKSEKELKKLENKDISQIYQEIAEKFNPQLIEKNQKRKPNSSEKKQWEEIQKIHQKLRKAIRLLLDSNYSFINYIKRGYYHSKKINHEDLIIEGYLSLLKAVEKFDPSYNRRLSTYSGFGVHQRLETFIDKTQLLGRSPKEGLKLTYYDNSYQSNKESTSYSLMETLSDDQTSENEEVFRQDIKTQINELLNLLEREVNLVIRSFYQISPVNLFDIYCLATETEKKELKKEMKLGNKNNLKLLQKYSLQEKKIHQLEVVKKYLSFFSQPKVSEAKIALFLETKEKKLNRLKESGLKQLKKLAEARNLGSFVI